MSDYIVIMTTTGNHGAASDHIDGFESAQQADAAGKLWAEAMRKHGGDGGRFEHVVVLRPST
jgi:hypothetical protein